MYLILIDERPLWRHGAAGHHAAAIAASIHLTGADILWAETTSPVLAQGIETGALEQVWWIGADDGMVVQPSPRQVRRAATFGRKKA